MTLQHWVFIWVWILVFIVSCLHFVLFIIEIKRMMQAMSTKPHVFNDYEKKIISKYFSKAIKKTTDGFFTKLRRASNTEIL